MTGTDDVEVTQKSQFKRLTGVTDTRPYAAEVLARLWSLGSGRRIARFLIGMGIVGFKNVPEASPVAIYVRLETGEDIRVEGDRIFVHNALISANAYEPIYEFVREFDRGCYPELEG